MLHGKKAVITGASRGIGREIALTYARCGADVAIVYGGNSSAAEGVAAEARGFGVRAVCRQCNVADFEQVRGVTEELAAELGGVDILVNNAGITRDTLLLRMSESDFDDVMDVNLKGMFNFTKHLSRRIMKSAAGRIINISSVIGLTGNAGQVNYAASKAGIVGLTKSVARELAPRGVTCNAIAPGFIETDMTAALPEEASAKLKDRIPLARLGKTADIAQLALFLASDAASYITGEVIQVDGGMCM